MQGGCWGRKARGQLRWGGHARGGSRFQQPSALFALQEAAGSYLKGILGFEERPLVSTGAAAAAAGYCCRCDRQAGRLHHRRPPAADSCPPLAALHPPAADYVNDPRSGIVDAACTQVIDGLMVKIYAWCASAPCWACWDRVFLHAGQGWRPSREQSSCHGRAAMQGMRGARGPGFKECMLPPPAPLAARYDNEWGYSARLVDVARMVARSL